ncbi:MAG: cupin domain-containing protein [Waterburya sp.]
MKKTIFRLSTWFIVLLATFCLILPANAALTTENIQVFHPKINKTVTMGKETFNYKTLTSKDSSETVSITEITQPPEYEGFLFQKHILQTPEEIYIIDGDFEFAFSQSNKKTKVSKGDIVSIPSGMPFGFKHTNKGEGKVMVFSRSKALPDMLSEIGMANQNSEPDIQTISSIAKKYGIEFLN